MHLLVIVQCAVLFIFLVLAEHLNVLCLFFLDHVTRLHKEVSLFNEELTQVLFDVVVGLNLTHLHQLEHIGVTVEVERCLNLPMEPLLVEPLRLVLVPSGSPNKHERHLDSDLARFLFVDAPFQLLLELEFVLLVPLLHALEANLLVHHTGDLLVLLVHALERLRIDDFSRVNLCLKFGLSLLDALPHDISFFLLEPYDLVPGHEALPLVPGFFVLELLKASAVDRLTNILIVFDRVLVDIRFVEVS